MNKKIVQFGICIGATFTLPTAALADEGALAEPAESTGRVFKVKKSDPTKDRLTRAYTTETGIQWEPLSEEYESMHLRLTGPGIEPYETTFKQGEPMSFGFYDEESTIWADGVYNWELSATPILSDETKELMAAAREEGSITNAEEFLRSNGVLPYNEGALKQSGNFRIADGQPILEAAPEPAWQPQQKRVGSKALVSDQDPLPNGVQLRDQVINDDLIVTSSLCVGQDCNNGESFGFDTIRLKENNLRIKFQDTSNSASFPTNDWQITANDSSNGGANKFSIDDIDGGRTPFTIEASAPSHSLYVDDGGRIGLGTSTPVVELHVVNGDSPTLRLEQDGSSGFTAQTWDVAGNEANFFVRDVTNGSQLPFKIKPGADHNALYIDADNDVGIGTASPASSLDVFRSNGTAKLSVRELSGTTAARQLIYAVNKGDASFRLENTDSEIIWDYKATADATLVIDNPDNTGNEFELQEDGSLVCLGTVTGLSDRNAKEDLLSVDHKEVLAKVSELPVLEWNYKTDKKNTRHIGPMAQDFRAAFGLGINDKLISYTDTAGIALSAIKGLNEVVEEKDAELEQLRAKTAKLEAQVKMLIEKMGADSSVE